MNTIATLQTRLAFFCTPTRTRVNWVDLDQTGQPPRIVTSLDGVQVHGAYELVSLDDAPLAVYRFDSDELAPDYGRDALTALAELVRVVNGMPNVSVDVDEQFRQLREQLRATVDNAETMIGDRDAELDRLRHKNECVVQEARRWKQRANQRKIYVEHYQQQEREMRSEIHDLQSKLGVARDAVDRAVNRSNHSNEHVETARARAHNAEINASQYASEAAELRRILGAVSAERDDLLGRIVEVQANALDTINRVAAALPEPIIDAEIVEPPFEIVAFYSADGNVPVVEISTTAISGRVRVNLNEGVIWDGDPESDERPGRWAEPLPHEEEPGVYHSPNSLGVLAEYQAIIAEQTRAVEAGTEKIEQGARVISIQLDTIRDQMGRIEILTAERDRHRADAEKLREINELQRQGIEESERSRRDALQQRDDLDRKLTESETMRKRLDEQLATERRAYETTSAALRAMLRERDAVLDVAERAVYPTAHGVSAMVAIGEFRAARDRLPKLETEEDARNDDSIRTTWAAIDQVVRFWRHSPANAMTEQLNIALSNLADSIKQKP